MSDEIIKELWAIKDQAAHEANYDMEERCRKLLEREGKASAGVVDLSKKRHASIGTPRNHAKGITSACTATRSGVKRLAR